MPGDRKTTVKEKAETKTKKAAVSGGSTDKARKSKIKKNSIFKTKAVPTIEAYLQYEGKSLKLDDIIDKCRADWIAVHKTRGQYVRNINVYLKTEEKKAYYVVNGKDSGSVEI